MPGARPGGTVGFSKILIRATNWVGDAVMSLPAIRAVRDRFPAAEIVVLARPWVADLYARETGISRVIPYDAVSGLHDLSGKLRVARGLRREKFDCAIVLQNAFEAAAVASLAGIPRRIGYARDGRGMLLTDAIPVPRAGEIPRHERFYYLELLRRAGLIEHIPPSDAIRLEGADAARASGVARLAQLNIAPPVVGVSPGAAYGTAKRSLPARFAEAAIETARAQGGSVVFFGSAGERELCQTVAQMVQQAGLAPHNLAGATTLREFIELAAPCPGFLTNHSGAQPIPPAPGVPTLPPFRPPHHSPPRPPPPPP